MTGKVARKMKNWAKARPVTRRMSFSLKRKSLTLCRETFVRPLIVCSGPYTRKVIANREARPLAIPKMDLMTVKARAWVPKRNSNLSRKDPMGPEEKELTANRQSKPKVTHPSVWVPVISV